MSRDASVSRDTADESPPMTPEPIDPARWVEIKTAFSRLVELPAAERDAALRAISPSIAADVARLLAFAEQAGPLDHDPTAALQGIEGVPSWIGRRLGAWRIVREIGHGGMGTVYEGARADDDFSHRVAIKTLRTGAHSDAMAQRFRQERQILATLQHPRIASLIDGGVTPDGVPYLVLEYIDGVPIDVWADQQRLSLAARIDLFRQVLDAVAAAHRQLVVHRDLKPNNILVGNDGNVKLVDFGIAKLLDSDSSATLGWQAFTVAYASPEQLAGGAVSTVSDVYSLGMVLHRLLSGQHAYPDATGSATEMLSAVERQPPLLPSEAATAAAATAMGLTSSRLARSLAGELDAIVLTAIRREPERRYPTVPAFSDDLARFLKGQPVHARPDTLAYRARKFVQRRRAVVAALAATAIALAGGSTVALWQAHRARLAAEHAALTSDFLARIIGAADVSGASTGPHLGPGATVADLLDSAAVRVSIEFRDDPRARLTLHTTIGSAYLTQERFTDATREYDSALVLARTLEGDTSLATAAIYRALGETAVLRGDMTPGITLLAESASRYEAMHDTLSADYLRALTTAGLAEGLLGNVTRSEMQLRRALRLAELSSGDPTVVKATAMAHLGGTLALSGNRFDQAVTLWRRALQMFDALPDGNVPEKADALWYVANVERDAGHQHAADSLNGAALAVLERAAGPMSQEVANHLATIASNARANGRVAAADSAISRALAIVAARAEMNPVIRDRVALEAARVRSAQHRYAEADSFAAATYRRRAASLNRVYRAEAALVWGEILDDQRQYAAAEPLLREAYATDSAALSPTQTYTVETIDALIALYRHWGKADLAAVYLSRVPHDVRDRIIRR